MGPLGRVLTTLNGMAAVGLRIAVLGRPESTAAAGAPSFFVNGRRHEGAYDLATLSRHVRERLPR